MANIAGRVSQERLEARHYFGELDADTLVAWLNQPRKATSPGRIERLLVNLQAALEEFPDFAWSATADGWTVRARMRQTRSLKAAQKELARYRFRPALRALAVRPTRPGKAVGTYEPAFEWDCEHEVGRAVIAIMELGRAGLLWRVRRCSKCGKWFYARFSHHRFCSNSCKEATNKSGEKWREYRRKYMQRYRAKETASLQYQRSRKKRGG